MWDTSFFWVTIVLGEPQLAKNSTICCKTIASGGPAILSLRYWLNILEIFRFCWSYWLNSTFTLFFSFASYAFKHFVCLDETGICYDVHTSISFEKPVQSSSQAFHGWVLVFNSLFFTYFTAKFFQNFGQMINQNGHHWRQPLLLQIFLETNPYTCVALFVFSALTFFLISSFSELSIVLKRENFTWKFGYLLVLRPSFVCWNVLFLYYFTSEI